MRTEVPVCQKCCMCLPLRYGLSAWGYLRLKNSNLIRKYYHHNLFLLTILIPLCIYIFGLYLHHLAKYSSMPLLYLTLYAVTDFVGLLAYVVIQIHVVLLVRSEIIKLKKGCQFRFENNVTEEEFPLNTVSSNGEKVAENKKETVMRALAGLLLFGMSYTLDRFIHHPRPGRTTDIVIASLVIILVSADIILGTIFIIGCHTKNAALIKQYYYHNLFLLALLVPFCLYVFGLSLYFMIRYRIPLSRFFVYMLSDLLGSLTYVVIQIYVTLLIRSQFIKLNSGCQFRFENKVAEAECSLNIEVTNGEKNIDDTARETNDYDEIRNYV